MIHHPRSRTTVCAILSILILFTSIQLAPADDWRDVTSVSDAVSAYPERMAGLMKSLDLDRKKLRTVQQAWDDRNLERACRELLSYHRTSDRLPRLLDPSLHTGSKIVERARDIMNDVFRGFGEKGHVPRKKDGHLKWSHRGPSNDRQFKNRINRHGHLRTLLRAYEETGKDKFVKRLDLNLRDWLIAAGGNVTPWKTNSLEPANRMPRWGTVFHSLRDNPLFQPATRLLLLSTIPDHARHLINNPGGGNWVSMTQYGVLTAGVIWPEFSGAEKWRKNAISKLNRNARNTVYPDGVQKELTASYHMVTLSRYSNSYQLLKKAGRLDSVPESFLRTVEDMWNYVAYSMRPDGTTPLNNDSDLNSEKRSVTDAAKRFDRSDWRYVATGGKQGRRPDAPPSRCFPWAGQLISRSGWNERAAWSFFDVGPSGIGHRHRDFGHLSINVFGRKFLVDSGRFAYQGKIARRFRDNYARHTRGHNTLLIDGANQKIHPVKTSDPLEESTKWVIRPSYDFARGHWNSYKNVKGELIHRRSLLYVRGYGWVVVDRIETDRPRKVDALWHVHPDNEVQLDGPVTSISNENGRMSITPSDANDWDVTKIEGQESPTTQGWFSRTYGTYRPAPCVRYRAEVDGTTTFAWVIRPARNSTPTPDVTLRNRKQNAVRVTIENDGNPAWAITVPVSGGKPNVENTKEDR